MRIILLLLLMTMMSFGATFQLSWTPRPKQEEIVHYQIYEDGRIIGKTQFSNYTIRVLTPGRHKYYVVAVNVWGEGIKSRIVTSPRVKSIVRK